MHEDVWFQSSSMLAFTSFKLDCLATALRGLLNWLDTMGFEACGVPRFTTSEDDEGSQQPATVDANKPAKKKMATTPKVPMRHPPRCSSPNPTMVRGGIIGRASTTAAVEARLNDDDDIIVTRVVVIGEGGVESSSGAAGASGLGGGGKRGKKSRGRPAASASSQEAPNPHQPDVPASVAKARAAAGSMVIDPAIMSKLSSSEQDINGLCLRELEHESVRLLNRMDDVRRRIDHLLKTGKRVRRRCSVEGCEVAARRGGLCARHIPGLREVLRRQRQCTVEGCERQSQKGGVCYTQ